MAAEKNIDGNGDAGICFEQRQSACDCTTLGETRSLEYSLEAQLSSVAADASWKPAPFKPPTDEELSFLTQFASRYAEPGLAQSWAAKLSIAKTRARHVCVFF